MNKINESGYYWITLKTGNILEVAYFDSDIEAWYLTGTSDGILPYEVDVMEKVNPYTK